jgi:hypothetical protein
MAFVYTDEEGHSLASFSQSERQYPTATNLARWSYNLRELYQQLRSWGKGIFHRDHPQHSYATRVIDLHAGINAFITALLQTHTQAGYAWKEAYMATVYFYRDHLVNLSKTVGSELQHRMIEIGRSDPAIQPVVAGQTALFVNTTPYLTMGVEFVQASAPKAKEKAKPKASREPPRESTPGACSLCKKPGCPGYNAPDYLCTNPIKAECRRCHFPHALRGRRKSPCGAPEPSTPSPE